MNMRDREQTKLEQEVKKGSRQACRVIPNRNRGNAIG